MRAKKILVNAYFAQNLGDDLFLKVLFDRYPNAQFHLLTTNDNYNKIFEKYKNVKIMKTLSVNIGYRSINVFKKIHDVFLNYRNYDALVNIGGSIFMESNGWQKSLVNRGYLPDKFKKNNKKTYIIGANFGPFEDDKFIEKHREFFAKFDDICFRDFYSYNIFEDLDNVRVAPDVVFNLENNDSGKKEKCVGFSIIDIEKRSGLKEYLNQYIHKIGEVVKNFIKLGYRIKLFSFCEKEGDLRAINVLLNDLDLSYKENIEVVNYSVDIDGFLDKYRACEVIIGTRFHSIILGMLFNQNVFPIIYSDKTFNVLKDLNIESNCCYIKDIEKLDVKDIIVNALNNKFQNRKTFLESDKQFEKLDLLFG